MRKIRIPAFRILEPLGKQQWRVGEGLLEAGDAEKIASCRKLYAKRIAPAGFRVRRMRRSVSLSEVPERPVMK